MPLSDLQAEARKIAAAEQSDSDGTDELCLLHGIEITCNDKNAPKGIQWIFGWRFKYRDRIGYTLGGITKRELIDRLLQESPNE